MKQRQLTWKGLRRPFSQPICLPCNCTDRHAAFNLILFSLFIDTASPLFRWSLESVTTNETLSSMAKVGWNRFWWRIEWKRYRFKYFHGARWIIKIGTHSATTASPTRSLLSKTFFFAFPWTFNDPNDVDVYRYCAVEIWISEDATDRQHFYTFFSSSVRPSPNVGKEGKRCARNLFMKRNCSRVGRRKLTEWGASWERERKRESAHQIRHY